MEIRKNSGPLKWVLIGISTLFLIVMLILPLTYVLVTAFGEGIKVFVAAVTDYYALKGNRSYIGSNADRGGGQHHIWNCGILVYHEISVSWKKDLVNAD